MRVLVAAVIGVALVLCLAVVRTAAVAKAPQVFNIKGPTVIAFFPPVSDSELDGDAELNDTLSDFQYYDDEVRRPFKKAGIELHEAYTRVFSVRMNGRLTTFRTTRKNDVGYYFIAPGKKAHVEYEVMTDEDLLDVAHDYFGIPLPDDTQDVAELLRPPGFFFERFPSSR